MTYGNLFDEFLDAVYPTCFEGWLNLPASEVLYRCDPIAYDTAYSDWVDSLWDGTFYPEHDAEVLDTDPEPL